MVEGPFTVLCLIVFSIKLGLSENGALETGFTSECTESAALHSFYAGNQQPYLQLTFKTADWFLRLKFIDSHYFNVNFIHLEISRLN